MTLHRVGLLGGMSWQSTATYYDELNLRVAERVGGHASAPVTIHSVDFAEIEALQRAADWPAQGLILADGAAALERAGAEVIALGTNTLHLVADQIAAAVDVPFLDLVDVAAAAVSHFDTVGLLATGFTMDSDLYSKRLAANGVTTLVPELDDRALVHRIIYDELVHGTVREQSRDAYLGVIGRLIDRGAEAVLLACTEIGMLIVDGDADVALYDTTQLHCAALTEFILTGELV